MAGAVTSRSSRAAEPSGDVLRVQLDYPLPEQLAVGAGTALFVCGWCFSPSRAIRSLAFVVDGELQPVAFHSMPRSDVFKALHPEIDPYSSPPSDPKSPDDPKLRSFRSGFWGVARVRSRDHAQNCEILMRAELADGSEAVAEIARITTSDRLEQPLEIPKGEGGGGPLVAICMATYEPSLELYRRQLDSIRTQTHRNWICIISDDSTSPRRFAAMQDAVRDDPRFVLSRSPRRLHFYHNFERALSLAPECARLHRHGGPGRLVASGQDRDTAARARKRSARLQRRPDRPPGRRRHRRYVLGPQAQQPRGPRLAC